MNRQHIKYCRGEEGSVLFFVVVVVLLLASLSLWFKSATSPVFTHHQDARRTLQAEYLMASAENVIKAELLAIPHWTTNQEEIKSFLNDFKRIELVDKERLVGTVRWVQAFNYTQGKYQAFEVKAEGPEEVIHFTKPVSYQLILDDQTRAVRKVQMRVSRQKDSYVGGP
ncbi:hypothetical protein EVA_07573 [gut metagenome]|uniref:Uncharacterized protein n=1 Tax=gut metagenome TaxID=749906 RepID=J9CVR9_9ZZZZ